jgi:hypothetical protein
MLETILYFIGGGLGLGLLFIFNQKFDIIDLSKIKERFTTLGTYKPPKKGDNE